MGDRVPGLDRSPGMLAEARRKLGPEARLVEGDAARPDLLDSAFDAVLCRHLLWARPDPRAVLARWSALPRPGGRMVLIEGRRHTGAGMTAGEVTAALPDGLRRLRHLPLSDDPTLWGRAVNDDRYLLELGRD